MKAVVTGSLVIKNKEVVLRAIEQVEKDLGSITELYTGFESDVDRIAVEWAKQKGIPVTEFKTRFPNNEERTKRSIAMGKAADVCVFLWNGKSVGTKTAIEQCDKNGIKKYIYKVE